jgi:uncharacterized protein YjbI with pentapeptide repeats
MLEEGVQTWNDWRDKNPLIIPDLSNIHLEKTNLSKANFSNTNLSRSTILNCNMSRTNVSGADISMAYLSRVDFSHSTLTDANFSNSSLTIVEFTSCQLDGVNFKACQFTRADFYGANMRSCDLTGSRARLTIFDTVDMNNLVMERMSVFSSSFNNINMSDVIGLENVTHLGPSSVGIDTLILSKGRLPKDFLRGCGVPEDTISYLPYLVTASQSIQFYSCFISYSTKDEDFARRLQSRMRDAGLRVWFAPEDMKGGKKIYEQIESAIQIHDRLLVVLSEASLQSEWVLTEVRRALKAEKKEARRKLFPIRVTDFDRIKEWELIDTDTGKDLAVEIRSYHIPDFSNWKDLDNFENAFNRLLNDLRAEEK